MIKLPEFVKRAAERAIESATHRTGMHTNGPAMASIEVSALNALLQRATQEIAIGVDCLSDDVTAVIVMCKIGEVVTVTGECKVYRGKSGMISFP